VLAEQTIHQQECLSWPRLAAVFDLVLDSKSISFSLSVGESLRPMKRRSNVAVAIMWQTLRRIDTHQSRLQCCKARVRAEVTSVRQ
jgi:hypothetical protein